MAKKSRLQARISAATERKLGELIERYGTQTEAVAVAIDRLHMQEFGPVCDVCGGEVGDMSPTWIGVRDSIWLCERCAATSAGGEPAEGERDG